MEAHNQTSQSKHFGLVRRTCMHLLIIPIRGYQFLLSPWLGNHCRFHPSCSHYAIEAIEQHGAGKGLLLALRRLSKCHPWHNGGFDPVPLNTPKRKMVNK